MEIKVLHQVMEWNEDVSAEVRKTLSEKKVCLINVMGSPGTGKTSLITELIARLRRQYGKQKEYAKTSVFVDINPDMIL